MFKSRREHFFVVFYVLVSASVLSKLLRAHISDSNAFAFSWKSADMSLCVTSFSSHCFPAFCSGLVKVNHLFHYIHFDLRCLYLLHIQGSENGQVPNTAGSLFFKVCDLYLPVSADCNLLRLYRL